MNDEEKHIKDFHQNSKGGFITPEYYFEKSREQLLRMANNGGFTTPQNYFDDAKTALLSKVAPPKKVLIIPYWKYAAAAVLLLSVGMYWLSPTTVGINLADLNEDEIIEYVQVNGVDDYTLVSMHSDELPVKTEDDEELIYQIEEELIVNEL